MQTLMNFGLNPQAAPYMQNFLSQYSMPYGSSGQPYMDLVNLYRKYANYPDMSAGAGDFNAFAGLNTAASTSRAAINPLNSAFLGGLHSGAAAAAASNPLSALDNLSMYGMGNLNKNMPTPVSSSAQASFGNSSPTIHSSFAQYQKSLENNFPLYNFGSDVGKNAKLPAPAHLNHQNFMSSHSPQNRTPTPTARNHASPHQPTPPPSGPISLPPPQPSPQQQQQSAVSGTSSMLPSLAPFNNKLLEQAKSASPSGNSPRPSSSSSSTANNSQISTPPPPVPPLSKRPQTTTASSSLANNGNNSSLDNIPANIIRKSDIINKNISKSNTNITQLNQHKQQQIQQNRKTTQNSLASKTTNLEANANTTASSQKRPANTINAGTTASINANTIGSTGKLYTKIFQI